MSAPSRSCVVLLTHPQRAAVASLLVQGEQATSAVAGLFHPAGGRPLTEYPCGRIVFGRWQARETGEEIVVCRRAADRVEIHCHGGRAAARAVIAALVSGGCREMAWQDWLRQSERDPIAGDARVALAGATTERTALILWDQHAGALRRAIDEIGACVASREAAGAIRQIEALAAWSELGRHLTEPWKVVLAGRPNTGKSSLINALVGYQRAIVHPTPGTTRDVVTAPAAVEGWPIELADTAGLRIGGEPLEAAGIALARDRLGTANLVVLVFDRSQRFSRDEAELARQWPHAVHVLNKCDLPPADDMVLRAGLRTSALRGDGVDCLARAIAGRLVPRVPTEGQAMPFLPWHVETLTAVRRALAAGEMETATALLDKFGPC